MDNLWYKNAVIYSMDVETYLDSNEDGTGDFQGMASKLGYLAGLGITCLWPLPFYPSPNRDNGYDGMDYYNVDPRMGTLEGFGAFMEKAQGYGIRVIIDLVINHTSIQHPWFQAARKDKNSKYWNYYVWSEEPLPHTKEKLIFAGEEEAVWTYDQAAEMYYLHRFYREQPDLNISNPEVREEILKVMEFWLNFGVSGFRVDAAEIFIEPYGMKEVKEGELENFLDEMQDLVSARRRDAILLAEANIKPEEINVYFYKEQRMHMLFNFYLNQHLFLGMARESAGAIIEALQKLPPISQKEQWLNFLRHHDELNLKLLDQSRQNEIYQVFAPEKGMRIYEKGIRRRLPPMFGNDKGRMELAYSLMFSLPGTPMIRYGEIGMGDDLKLPGRASVRTAMQWSDDKNGGFSDAPENMLSRPVISEGEYGFKKLNVKEQQNNPASFLKWMERLINIRKECPEIGFEKLGIIKTGRPEVFIHSFSWQGGEVLFFHNLSKKSTSIPKNEVKKGDTTLTDLFGKNGESQNHQHPDIFLNSYGYRWFRIGNGHNK